MTERIDVRLDRTWTSSRAALPNGPRLSGGRPARWRKAVGRQSVPARAQHSASSKAITARQLQALVRQHPVYLQPAWDLRLIRAIGVAELPLKVALLRHHNCPVQARQHDWKHEECYQAIDPECHTQVDTDRRDVERVTRTPKRAIADQRESGLRGKDVGPCAFHGIVSRMREHSGRHEQHETEDSGRDNRKRRHCPQPVMHRDADKEETANEDRRENENVGTIRFLHHRGCCLTDRA